MRVAAPLVVAALFVASAWAAADDKVADDAETALESDEEVDEEQPGYGTRFHQHGGIRGGQRRNLMARPVAGHGHHGPQPHQHTVHVLAHHGGNGGGPNNFDRSRLQAAPGAAQMPRWPDPAEESYADPCADGSVPCGDVSGHWQPEFRSVPPFVAGAMNNMHDSFGDLRSQERAAAVAHQHFVEAAGLASQHVNDGRGIRFKVAYRLAKIKGQRKRVQQLENQHSRLVTSRNHLAMELHSLMDPKLAMANGRLKLEKKLLNKTERTFQAMHQIHEGVKNETINLLSQKRSAHEALAEANAELAKAQADQQAAAGQYFSMKKKASEAVQHYQVIVQHYKGAQSKVLSQKVQAKKMSMSFKRMQHIFGLEWQKLQHAFVDGQMRLQNNVKKAQAGLNETEHALWVEKNLYKMWQQEQMNRTIDKARAKHDYDTALQAYGDMRRQTLENAHSMVTHKAEQRWGNGDGDWAWNDWELPAVDPAPEEPCDDLAPMPFPAPAPAPAPGPGPAPSPDAPGPAPAPVAL